jgi:hypothetical protein
MARKPNNLARNPKTAVRFFSREADAEASAMGVVAAWGGRKNLVIGGWGVRGGCVYGRPVFCACTGDLIVDMADIAKVVLFIAACGSLFGLGLFLFRDQIFH